VVSMALIKVPSKMLDVALKLRRDKKMVSYSRNHI